MDIINYDNINGCVVNPLVSSVIFKKKDTVSYFKSLLLYFKSRRSLLLPKFKKNAFLAALARAGLFFHKKIIKPWLKVIKFLV